MRHDDDDEIICASCGEEIEPEAEKVMNLIVDMGQTKPKGYVKTFSFCENCSEDEDACEKDIRDWFAKRGDNMKYKIREV